MTKNLFPYATLYRSLLPWIDGKRGRSRARCTLSLEASKVFIPDIPEAENSDRYLLALSENPSLTISIFIHDILPITHPVFFEDDSVRNHVALLELVAQASEVVVASEVLRKDLCEIVTANSGLCPPIRVEPIPIGRRLVRAQNANKGSAVKFLFVGGFERRKGLLNLVQTFQGGTPPNVEIYVPGLPNPQRWFELALFEMVKRVPGFFPVGNASDDEFEALLAGVDATMYLSHAEGYGIPIIESLFVGKPTVTIQSKLNQHFSETLGGVVQTPAPKSQFGPISFDNKVFKSQFLARCAAEIRYSEIPQDSGGWAARVLSSFEGD